MSFDNDASLPLGGALELLRSIWQLNHAIERVSSRMVQTLGVTAQQRMIIRFVGKYPGVTAGLLATELHVDPGTISAALRRLEEKKLIERRRGLNDKRRITVGLTAAGRALDLPAAATVEAAVERLIELTDAEALQAGLTVLGELTALLEGELQSAPSPRAEPPIRKGAARGRPRAPTK